MSEQMNYMQRVGHSKCVRCDFETSDDMTFEQQDAAMMAHLADKHPDWMGIGQAEPSLEPESAPAFEAQAPAVPRYRINSDGALEQSGTGTLVTLPDHLAELAQLRARVAILDAQGVALPELDITQADRDRSYEANSGWDTTLFCRERQLLDALRAVQAWREVAANGAHALMQHDTYSGAGLEYDFNRFVSQKHNTIAAYDALAGKGE